MNKELNSAIKSVIKASQALSKQIDYNSKKTVNCTKEDSSSKDIKLSDDFKMHNLIKEMLSETGIEVFGEEEKFNDRNLPNRYWLIDGLDGSFNFDRGIPFYAISVALVVNESEKLGIIYDLSNKNIYHTDGKNAYKNDKKFTMSYSRKSIKQACIATGFPVKFNKNEKYADFLIDLVHECRKVRMFGCASQSILFVAQGIIDIYYEENIFIWDVAGALAIAKASGCHVEKVRKSNCVYSILVTGSKDMLNEVLNLRKEFYEMHKF